MSIWDNYPKTYRKLEVERLHQIVQSGDCAAVCGLSGSGKSNLMGFFTNRTGQPPAKILIDCNRLATLSPFAFLSLLSEKLDPDARVSPSLTVVEKQLSNHLNAAQGQLCLVIDRFDALLEHQELVAQNMRALRDAFKYQLTFLVAVRRPPDLHTEMGELFYAHTLWLGPLSNEDALWSASTFARRKQASWDQAALEKLVELSWGYPSFLRAACEAYNDGIALEVPALLEHPPVKHLLQEFWADAPTPEHLSASGLAGHPWLLASAPFELPQDELTAKEQALLAYLRAHPSEICEKQNLIEAVWPEDVLFATGLRDDSLAQLIRRLRVKIETDPSNPQHILTVPGRGYRFAP